MNERDEHGLEGEEAAEHLVHGLLRVAHEDPAMRERRIERLMDAIDDEPAAPRGRRLRLVLSVAASLLVALTVVGVLSGGESARAFVAETLDAMHAGLDRRYALAIELLGEEELSLAGTVDVDGRGRVVLTLDTAGLVPFDRVLVGRDEVGEWAMHEGDPARRLDDERGWPRWMRLQGTPVLLESIDALVEELARYELEHGPDDSDDLVHVIATASEPDPERPPRVELWIERSTHVVTRLQLAWPGVADDPALREEIDARHPGFDAGDRRHVERALAPARITYTLLGRPTFPEDWFSPEAHGG